MIIEPDHFRYLAIQRGEVSDYQRDLARWQAAYENSLQVTYDSLRPVLPDACFSILDVGSGLGGIDVLLHRHYGGCRVRLFDGAADAAEARRYPATFNDMSVAMDFLQKNGVHDCGWFEAPGGPITGSYDLIVSFAAYAFHLDPEDYIDMLLGACIPGTVLVFDVRKSRPDWLHTLCSAFGHPRELASERKFTRYAWKYA